MALFLGAAGAQAAETASRTFTQPGEAQLLVPAGVRSLHVELVGGHGGEGKNGAPGGLGATIGGTLTVTPGEALVAEVGGDGQAYLAGGIGGYGGGGGTIEIGFGAHGGGGGGGASDVRTCSATSPLAPCSASESLLSRLLVAGGGGGGGGNGHSPDSLAGGNGGAADQSGSGGQSGPHSDPGGSAGARGQLSSGGAAGATSVSCSGSTVSGCSSAGTLGAGGIGGQGEFGGGGGGGGGGVFGGGGGGGGLFAEFIEGEAKFANGAGGGGGGGSSGVPLSGSLGAHTPSAVSLLPSAEGAQPLVAISWTMPPPASVTGAPTALTSSSATLTGSVNPDGSLVEDCHFTISPPPAAGASLPCSQQVGASGTPMSVSAVAGGLSAATTYTVTLASASAQGASVGAGVTFTTLALQSSSTTGLGAPLTVSALKISRARFHRGRRRAALQPGKSGSAGGATISFVLSRAATAHLAFEASRPGELRGRRCVAAARHRGRARRCARYAPVGHGVTVQATGGSERLIFDGVVDGGARLATGSYRVTLTAVDQGRKVTSAQHPKFTLLP